MRRSNVVSHRREAPQANPYRIVYRTLRGGLLVFLAGALVALAGTPANLQEALQAQKSLVAENPRDADLLNDLGNLLALAGDFAQAEEIYHRALEIEPDDVTALYNLALVLREQGELKAARKTFEAILEVDPRHAWTHYQLGALLDEQDNRSRAVQHYAEAFAIDRTLTSPKVNPHIVENQLATEALLLMYVEESPSTQAPRLYEKPGNVADLLLPRQSAETTAESADGDAHTEVDPVPRRHGASFTPPPVDEDDLDSAEEDTNDLSTTSSGYDPGSPRTLDASTLRTRTPKQPASEQDMGQRSTQGGSTSSQVNPVATGILLPSADSAPATDNAAGAAGTPQDFTPSLNSTGRLDLQLLPATEPDAAVSST